MKYGSMNGCVLVLVLVLVCLAPSCPGQLFKKAAERRASRQGGAPAGQYQPPKKGLFGKSKEPKTGGLFNRSGGSTPRSNGGAEQNQKTGLFGKPKEPKTGGLFNRNRVDASGQPIQKPGLFGKKRAAENRYANNFTQQQRNQQASASYVQRSQRVADSQPLFRPPTPADGSASAGTSQTTGTRQSGRVEPTVLSQRKPDLPELKQSAASQPIGSHSALVRSRPKVPRRTQPSAGPRPRKTLQNTSQDLPEVAPTGTITVPVDVRTADDILA